MAVGTGLGLKLPWANVEDMMRVVGEAWSGTFASAVSEARCKHANYKMLEKDVVGGRVEKEKWPSQKERNEMQRAPRARGGRARRKLTMDGNPGGSPARPRTHIVETIEFLLTKVDIHKTAQHTCQTGDCGIEVTEPGCHKSYN